VDVVAERLDRRQVVDEAWAFCSDFLTRAGLTGRAVRWATAGEDGGMRVFVSYRREDSWAVGRLRDRLTLEHHNVFLDVDDIPPGVDFRVVISSTLRDIDVVLAVIGAGWTQEDLSRETDPVRAELHEALQQNKRLIPVLIGDTPMPQPDALPVELEPFAYLNATRVRADPDFPNDADRLIAALGPSDPDDNNEVDRQPPRRTATVSLVRPKQAWNGSSATIRLEVDGREVGGVKNGETVELEVPAGMRKVVAIGPLRAFNRSTELTVNFEPGSRTTLRVKFLSKFKNAVELVQIPE